MGGWERTASAPSKARNGRDDRAGARGASPLRAALPAALLALSLIAPAPAGAAPARPGQAAPVAPKAPQTEAETCIDHVKASPGALLGAVPPTRILLGKVEEVRAAEALTPGAEERATWAESRLYRVRVLEALRGAEAGEVLTVVHSAAQLGLGGLPRPGVFSALDPEAAAEGDLVLLQTFEARRSELRRAGPSAPRWAPELSNAGPCGEGVWLFPPSQSNLDAARAAARRFNKAGEGGR